MTKINIHIQDSFSIAPGVAMVLAKSVAITADQLASALRQWVASQCPVDDDAGCDWYHDTTTGAICIGGTDWIVSTDATLADALALADRIDGRDHSISTRPDQLVGALPGRE